ncbi:MAG: phosphatase PAP2 family protein [Clostridia bacterium]|nr:phosphatase PAP2 family protein [Clostridia bacterium]
MQKINKKYLFWSAILFLLFALWTALICFVDVKAVGPNGSSVGFSTLNAFFHKLTGVNMTFYNISDWGGLVPVAFCLGFAVLGLCQWIKCKNILKVDYSILLLGGFYIIVIAAYILFEYVVINYRPILINGYLEASYPSSTTLLVLCVMPTAIMQFNRRIKNSVFKKVVSFSITAFIILMVALRLLSGVHWLTDIIGGALVSASLVTLYRSLI